MSVKPHSLKVAEIADILNVTPKTIMSWLNEGMPSVKCGKGKGVRYIDPVEAGKWLALHGKTIAAERLRAIPGAKKMVAAMVADTTSAIPPPANAEPDSVMAFVRRMRQQEASAMVEWVAAGGDPVARQYARDGYLKAADLRLKAEKQLAEIQRSQADVIPRAQVLETYSRAGATLKTHMASLHTSIAPQAEGKSAREIAEIIRVEVERIVNQCAKALKVAE